MQPATDTPPDDFDPRPALRRVLADPKAKPADVVKAAELLRALGGADSGADVLDMDDAELLRVARQGLTEGGGPQNEGPVTPRQARDPSDAVRTRISSPSLTGRSRVGGEGAGVPSSEGPATDPSFYADPELPPSGIDPLS
jgi:hypothetical protein